MVKDIIHGLNGLRNQLVDALNLETADEAERVKNYEARI